MSSTGLLRPITPPSPSTWKGTVPLTMLLGMIITTNVLFKIIRRTILVPRLTIMDELPNFGLRRADGKIRGRAVICGGSIAGLLAAAVCSDHFESVLVIEAEGSPAEIGLDRAKEREFRIMHDGRPTPIPLRKRLLQYMGIHVYLPPVVLGLQRLFSGTLQDELDYFGFSLAPDVWDSTDPRTPRALPITREALETLVRRLVVNSRTNISFTTGTVDGFRRQSREDLMLSGVTVRGEQDEDATFIVDATGAAQCSYHKWLENAEFKPISPSLYTEYDPRLVYSQSVYTLPDALLPKFGKIFPYGLIPGAVFGNNPDYSTGDPRLLYMYLYEDRQRGGWGTTAEQRPRGLTELRAYTKSLHNSEHTPQWVYEIFDLLEAHEEECRPWYSDVHTGKMSFVKYHKAEKESLPSNWVAIGDSMLKLNPTYGQGIVKSVMDSVALDSLLRKVPSRCGGGIPADFSTRFFNKAVARTEGMWEATKAQDYGFPTTVPAKGETLAMGAFMRAFGRHLMYAGVKVAISFHFTLTSTE
ncbi:hypothetical protein FRB96_008101 [Tulasnella sp. 330]|nr:hypothetical protein FRB96_008101 [Tulasnella sp. 330]KAG8884465.1 hypothetical protein FRB97_004239 [Tulasnella sp. 331]